MAGATFETIEIVADCHGQGEELFEGFLWVLKIDGQAAGLEADAGREILELLIDDADGGFDEKLRLLDTLFPELLNYRCDPAAAAHLVFAVFALGDLAEAGDQGVAIGESVGSDMISDTGRHDLLGPAAADAEKEFDRGAINERTRGRA
jgi:hypothetical protein